MPNELATEVLTKSADTLAELSKGLLIFAIILHFSRVGEDSS